MKLEQLLKISLMTVTGIFGLLVTAPVYSQVEKKLDRQCWDKCVDLDKDKLVKIDRLSQNPAPTATSQIVEVRIAKTTNGIEIILVPMRGEPLQASNSISQEKASIFEVNNAVLALPNGGNFQAVNPVEGITAVEVVQVTPNSVRVSVTGTNEAPTAEVVSSSKNLIVSVTPTISTTEKDTQTSSEQATQTPNQEIEILVTRERPGEYFESDASTATRTKTPLRDIPQSIQIVPQQVIEDQNVNRLDEILRNTSGVASGDSFANTTERLVIRGFAQDTILRDGFSQSSFLRGFDNVDRYERVEVLKGPASVLYGNLEPGGVVNLVTKKPFRDPTYTLKFEGGSFGYAQPSLDFSGPINSDKTLLYRLNASYETKDGFRDFEQNSNVFSIFPSISWKLGKDTSLLLNFGYSDAKRPFDRGLVAIGDEVADVPLDRVFQDPDAEYKIQETIASYQLEHRFSKDWTLRHGFNFIASDISDFKLDSGFIDDSGILERDWRANDDLFENYSVQTNVVGKFDTGSIKHQLLFGVDYDRATVVGQQTRLPDEPVFPIDIFTLEADPISRPDRDDLTLAIRDENVKVDLVGIYLQDQIAFTNNLKLTLGGRLDIYDQKSLDLTTETSFSQSENRFSPRIGLVDQPIRPISLYASYAESFNLDRFALLLQKRRLELH
jgi:iron complex outermembrane receptor protein